MGFSYVISLLKCSKYSTASWSESYRRTLGFETRIFFDMAMSIVLGLFTLLLHVNSSGKWIWISPSSNRNLLRIFPLLLLCQLTCFALKSPPMNVLQSVFKSVFISFLGLYSETIEIDEPCSGSFKTEASALRTVGEFIISCLMLFLTSIAVPPPPLDSLSFL